MTLSLDHQGSNRRTFDRNMWTVSECLAVRLRTEVMGRVVEAIVEAAERSPCDPGA